MANEYNINVKGSEKSVKVTETKFRELEVSNRVYVVPAGVVKFIEDLAGEIERQQERKEVSDLVLDEKINVRIRSMLQELAENGMLSDDLDSVVPLPPGVTLSCGEWTFLDEATKVARKGLKNKNGHDIREDLVSPVTVRKEMLL